MEAGDEGWRDLLARGLAQRRAARDRHFLLCLESLQALTAHAAGSGVRLAAETRYHYNDIPDFEEFASILEMFASRGVGYWHDVGHAHTQQTLGLATAQAYLSRYRSHLLGFHLHDAKGTRDHWPPGEGEIDFGALRAYAHADHLYVCEVASRHPANHLAASLEFLRDLGLGS
jgi:sugar phosphate isomerase/epimerase